MVVHLSGVYTVYTSVNFSVCHWSVLRCVLSGCVCDAPVLVGVAAGHGGGRHPTAEPPEGVPGPLRLGAAVRRVLEVQAAAAAPLDLQHDGLLVAGQDAQGVPLAELTQVPAPDLRRERGQR